MTESRNFTQERQNPLNLNKNDILKEIEVLRSEYIHELTELRQKYGPQIAKRIAYIAKYL